jgi:hypothetical protein
MIKLSRYSVRKRRRESILVNKRRKEIRAYCREKETQQTKESIHNICKSLRKQFRYREEKVP